MKKKIQIRFLPVIIFILICCMGCGEKNTHTGELTANVTPGQKHEDWQKDKKTEGYVFEYKGICIEMDARADLIIRALGEPISCFEATSCVFDGTDKIYNYGSFELDTYELEGTDYVSCIYFRDDLVATREGISLFMPSEELFTAYGEPGAGQVGEYIYEKGGMTLRFLVKDGVITSIEYKSAVWNMQ